jgi:YidC/Oxa1 family membrane protein insertase
MGWARPFAVGLLTILIWLQGIIQNWGVTVMVLTTLVKLAVLPLAYWAMKMSARTMYEQQKIKPELDALNKKYADDPQARSAAMLKLYRDHNINPAGALRGCLPAFAQMPVFVGLYALFDQAVELRGQEFLWIADLSQPDRLFSWGINLPILGPAFNILPVLMGITQYLSMKTMQLSQPTDEMQAQIQKNMMTVMPVMFTFLMFQMPAGLLLYWCTSNTWSIAQGWVTKKYVDRKIEEYRAAERVAVAVPARPRR